MLNKAKLQNIVEKADGSYTARCPACASSGADAKGEHLIVYPDGAFGCVVHEDDKDHRKAIAVLVGAESSGARRHGPVAVSPVKTPASTRILVVGRLGQQKATAPEKNKAAEPPPPPKTAKPKRETPPPQPEEPAGRACHRGDSATMEEVMVFLKKK
jgi:hypothetical protein